MAASSSSLSSSVDSDNSGDDHDNSHQFVILYPKGPFKRLRVQQHSWEELLLRNLVDWDQSGSKIDYIRRNIMSKIPQGFFVWDQDREMAVPAETKYAENRVKQRMRDLKKKYGSGVKIRSLLSERTAAPRGTVECSKCRYIGCRECIVDNDDAEEKEQQHQRRNNRPCSSARVMDVQWLQPRSLFPSGDGDVNNYYDDSEENDDSSIESSIGYAAQFKTSEDDEDMDGDDDTIWSLNNTTRFQKSHLGGYVVVPSEAAGGVSEGDEDQVEYLVDSLLDVRRTRLRGQYEFLVRWVGYKESTWEPLENLNVATLRKDIDDLLRVFSSGNDSDFDDDDEFFIESGPKLQAKKRKAISTPPAKQRQRQPEANKRSKKQSSNNNNNKSARRTTATIKPKKLPGQGVSPLSVSPLLVAYTKKSNQMMSNSIGDGSAIVRGTIRTCLASRIFGQRLRKYPERPLSEQLLPIIKPDGMQLALLGTKINDAKGFRGQKTLSAYYVVEEGFGFSKISLQVELEKLADFGAIETNNKCASRLELLFTEAGRVPGGKNNDPKYRVIENLSPDDFEEIEESNHVGCGFIPRHMLQRFLGAGKHGLLSTSIQVRILLPSLGLFKGVLQAKNEIERIQLPSSMRKVGPSRHDDLKGQALLLIRNIFPSTTNRIMAKMFSGNDLSKSAVTSLSGKPLSYMLRCVFQEAGVPVEVIEDYETLIKEDVKSVAHASVIGLCDPTQGSAIPAGHVFLTGMNNLPGVTKIVVTRFPCTSKYDQRTLDVVKEKPESMKEADWNELTARSFGEIIFGKPQESHISIPETIADGDLDGDLYFCIWHGPFLHHTFKHASSRLAVDNANAAAEVAVNNAWLQAARNFMCDTQNNGAAGKLIGALHKRWTALVHEKNSDAEAFGQAFKKSIDLKKHGGKVYLPERLWDQIHPNSLHRFFTGSK